MNERIYQHLEAFFFYALLKFSFDLRKVFKPQLHSSHHSFTTARVYGKVNMKMRCTLHYGFKSSWCIYCIFNVLEPGLCWEPCALRI